MSDPVTNETAKEEQPEKNQIGPSSSIKMIWMTILVKCGIRQLPCELE